jgi:hypothetical protein
MGPAQPVNALSRFAAPASHSQPRFKLIDDHGTWWLVGPDKKRFFSLGVCCVEPGTSFAEYDTKNPSYAAFKYYPEGKQAWAEDVVQRLQSWNFNTIGAWSDTKTLKGVNAPNLRFTPILHMGSGAGAPWKDMWDPAVIGLMSDIARDQIKDLRAEPRVIGYFSDNEQGWWNGALFDWAWKGPNTRRKLVSQLADRYKTWAALMRDFDPEGARSFHDLQSSGRLFLRPGGNGIVAVHTYIGMLASRYYFLCNSLIKKFDPNALYLGDRFISNFYPEVAVAAGKYADVVSTNLNADWNDGTFAPYFLPSLYRLTKKPLMITEYYMCAKQNRTGNKNDSSGFPVVETQEQRAQGFKSQTDTFLTTPYVVGAHWFQYYDEPKNGRGDGENYDMGLVDVNNDPYEELTHTSSSLDLDSRAAQTTTNATSIPEIPASDAADLEKWPRSLSYVKPLHPSDRGDAYVAWTPDAAYVAIYWNEDRFAEALYRGSKIPIGDEPILAVQGIKDGGFVRFIDGQSQKSGLIELVSLKMGVRNTAIIRIPAKAFGLLSIASNQKLKLDLSLQTRSRAYSIQWHCNELTSP